MAPPLQRGLRWTQELFDVVSTWTVQPDILAIKALTLHHLRTLSDCEIAPYTSGAFNKLYLVSSIGQQPPQCYIMRVALPVDPYFKTASEVATLDYLRRHTSIPVPCVIAYDATTDNELGFEWVLMTRLDGVSLKQFWPTAELSWEDRVQATVTVAGYVKQLKNLKSDKMGSVYHRDQKYAALHWLEREVDAKLQCHDDAHFVPLNSDPKFVIGPMVSIPYFYGNRIQIASDRGPFDTSAAWLTSLLNLQIASTTLKASSPMNGDDYDSDDISELDDTIEAARELLSVLPMFFPSEPCTSNETFVLDHDDLSANNILIDPASHRVTGLVDWECVSLQPTWKTERAPQFLYGPEIDTCFYERNCGGPIPDIPPPPDEGQDLMHLELRERVEQMLLRRVLNRELGKGENQVPAGKLMRIYESKVCNVETCFSGIVKWVKKVKSGGNPELEEQKGIYMYLWPEN